MTTQKVVYGSGVPIPITIGSLVNNAARQSAAVNNSSGLYLDALASVTVKAPTTGVSGNSLVNVYVAGSIDGTTWPGEGSGNLDGVNGIDATITLEAPTNLILLSQITTPTASGSYVSEPSSLASVFNGIIPPSWSLIVQNLTGQTLQSGSSASYIGINTTSV
jgi:hypothetical protein